MQNQISTNQPTIMNNPSTSQTIKPPKEQTDEIPQSNSQMKFIHNVQVKGTLPGTKSKTIELQPHSNKLIVYSSQQNQQNGKEGKQFPLNEVTFTHQNKDDNKKRDLLHIDTNQGKKYSIKGENSSAIASDIKKCQTIYKVNQQQFQEQQIINIPMQFNYMTPLQSGLNFQKILLPHNQVIFNQQQMPQLSNVTTQAAQDFSQYPRRKFYFDPEDWLIDKEKGRVRYINEEKKKSQNKVLTWVIKKFLTTGSFMGISFPTFVMKPQSILQSYAKAIGAAPFLLDNVTNPVQRMKKFICLIHTFSVIFADMAKPFNPPIGQTFQARIANGNFYAQQICHHPPISAFLFQGKGYKLSGSLELTANIGANSATGTFVGDLILQFDDGMVYKGRVPGGQFSGFLVGQNKFQAYGGFYAYNNKKLVCSASTRDKNNFFEGFIGKLKPKYQAQFFTKVHSSGRFLKFPFYDRKCFDTVFSFMDMAYNHRIVFDEKEYLNLHQEKYLPFLPEQIKEKKLLLKSDSRFRKDIPLRKELKFEDSQEEKEKLEDEERYFRKLREKYDPIHHKKS